MKRIKDLIREDRARGALRPPKGCIPAGGLIEYAHGGMTAAQREAVESHISGCYHCLDAIVSIHEGRNLLKKRKGLKMKIEHLYLAMAIVSFILSFIFKEHFFQFLTATIILGAKWIIDSKTSRTLITIRKAIGSDPASNIKNRLKSEKIL